MNEDAPFLPPRQYVTHTSVGPTYPPPPPSESLRYLLVPEHLQVRLSCLSLLQPIVDPQLHSDEFARDLRARIFRGILHT